MKNLILISKGKKNVLIDFSQGKYSNGFNNDILTD